MEFESWMPALALELAFLGGGLIAGWAVMQYRVRHIEDQLRAYAGIGERLASIEAKIDMMRESDRQR